MWCCSVAVQSSSAEVTLELAALYEVVPLGGCELLRSQGPARLWRVGSVLVLGVDSAARAAWLSFLHTGQRAPVVELRGRQRTHVLARLGKEEPDACSRV